jgi:hypothetical protein
MARGRSWNLRDRSNDREFFFYRFRCILSRKTGELWNDDYNCYIYTFYTRGSCRRSIDTLTHDRIHTYIHVHGFFLILERIASRALEGLRRLSMFTTVPSFLYLGEVPMYDDESGG